LKTYLGVVICHRIEIKLKDYLGLVGSYAREGEDAEEIGYVLTTKDGCSSWHTKKDFWDWNKRIETQAVISQEDIDLFVKKLNKEE